MWPKLRPFAELTEFLIENHRFELVHELTLATANNLVTTSVQEQFQLADFAAKALYKSKNYEAAVTWARRACQVLPANGEAAHRLATCLISARHEAEAEDLLRALIQNFPTFAFMKVDLSIALFYQGKFDESQACLERLLKELPEDHPDRRIVYFNLHWHWMRKARFKEAMQAFLSTEPKFTNMKRPQLQPTDDIRGKRVLVLHECGGAGDEIVNVRFVKHLAERGAHVIWRTHHRLEGVFGRVQGMGEVVSRANAADPNVLDYDFWTSEGSLVRFFDVDLKDLSREPYLFANPTYIAAWSQKIPDRGKLRVGLRWQGTMTTDMDMHRSVPFAEFRKFLDVPGAEFYSLQRDTGLDELLPSDPVTDLSTNLKTWEDTAAAIHCLDVVITNCTSIAHFSGALGKKTWLYTPLGCFYIWALPGDTSYWYKDVRLFRQTRRREWAAVTQAVRAELEKTCRAFSDNRKKSLPDFFSWLSN